MALSYCFRIAVASKVYQTIFVNLRGIKESRQKYVEFDD